MRCSRGSARSAFEQGRRIGDEHRKANLDGLVCEEECGVSVESSGDPAIENDRASERRRACVTGVGPRRTGSLMDGDRDRECVSDPVSFEGEREMLCLDVDLHGSGCLRAKSDGVSSVATHL